MSPVIELCYKNVFDYFRQVSTSTFQVPSDFSGPGRGMNAGVLVRGSEISSKMDPGSGETVIRFSQRMHNPRGKNPTKTLL